MTSYIDDGMVFDGVIDAVPGLLRAHKFKYREAEPGYGLVWQESTPASIDNPGAKTKLAADIVCKHLVEMYVQADDKQWERLTFGPEQAVKLKPAVLFGALNHILGYRAPSLRTEAPKSPAPSDSPS